MRKIPILVVIFLASSAFLLTPSKSLDSDVSYFDQFFPGMNPSTTGCHESGLKITNVGGNIQFNSSWVTVEKGKDFSLSLLVNDFAGNLADSSNDIALGFNTRDEDNSVFLTESQVVMSHLMDPNGTSISPLIANFTTPDITGNYSLVAYGIAAGTSPGYFDWIRGQVRVEVIEPIGPQGAAFTLETDGIIDNEIELTVRFVNLTDVKSIELSIDGGSYELQTLNPQFQTVQKYSFNVTTLTPGAHTVAVRVTNQADLITEDVFEFEVPEPTTSSSIVTTSSSTTISSQTTITDTVDHGILSNPIILGALIIVMIVAIVAPWILMRRSAVF